MHRDAYDRFLDHAAAQVEQVRLGDPFDPATTSAPILLALAGQRLEEHLQGRRR